MSVPVRALFIYVILRQANELLLVPIATALMLIADLGDVTSVSRFSLISGYRLCRALVMMPMTCMLMPMFGMVSVTGMMIVLIVRRRFGAAAFTTDDTGQTLKTATAERWPAGRDKADIGS